METIKNMSKITILKKDITDFDTECIVNAANEHLLFGSGVCGAIFRAAGVYKLEEECKKIGHCKTGNVVITPAFDLKENKYIIHAVGPIYSKEESFSCRKLLSSVYKNSLTLMLENGCHSIAFPLISSGIYGYPKDEAWLVALETCKSFIDEHKDIEIDIYFAVIDEEMYSLGQETLTKISC